ncbi:hypothetical protein [Amycolatopsis rubida]|uniref:Uncharacterized protein n=1 Tax=Amycolatopsis rubida TaxID=112413 RepID=A0A1I5IIG7_9PSEU|nr:hypothetical protein [Amycolatopsis rubida]SFO60204.1 hypothetical protein SAMN05421854_102483 [Amycolatopsis rubida]
MQQPLCANTDDGPCPNFALNGIEVCLVHTPIAQDSSGFTVDIGYRPGGLAPAPTPLQMFATALVGFQQAVQSATEAVRQFDAVAAPPEEQQP